MLAKRKYAVEQVNVDEAGDNSWDKFCVGLGLCRRLRRTILWGEMETALTQCPKMLALALHVVISGSC